MNKSILASLITIGLIGAAVSGGTTLALFNDQEQSEDNTFASGAIDLKVDWNESYNGEHVESQSLTDNPSAIFNISDVKPGDYGEATVSLHVFDNPAYINMSMNQTSNEELSCTEPEAEAEGGDCGTTGELGEHLEFVIWNDDGDNVLQDDEEVYFNGTAEELSEEGIDEGFQLDSDPSTPVNDPFTNSTTHYVGIKWNLPRDTGNEAQTDAKTFDIGFTAVQARHNGNGTVPQDEPVDNGTDDNQTNGNETPQDENVYYQADLAGGEPIEDLSQQTYSGRNDMIRYMHGGPNDTISKESAPNQVACVSGSEGFVVDTAADTASVNFTVSQDDCQVSLVSYAKPYPGWIADRADEQVLFDNVTQTLDTGNHTYTVDIPDVN